ncbi:Tetrahydrofolate synthase [Zostera marina]|uniref:Folylpolyglutamate synthase n=1 Tax=Zostera marina TaxID=29655 RepID=A0A0K9Q1K0_ZOSMR|nr:Tetrahydrofolate synthase [Zostera marina]
MAAAVSSMAYEDALDRLFSLKNRQVRGDGADHMSQMPQYLKILELEEPISKLKVIHVAGTKGKGSTCSFVESILRNCGFNTGLFTSPHLIDIRERFKLQGVEVSQEKFRKYFWWCWKMLEEKTNDNFPMPAFFCFLTLLAFKIFAEDQVDVAIMEVGLGGKYDATNVVQTPVVCGISSLGYDHMQILGYTLAEIAGDKAGIFKKAIPAHTAPQPEEAMHVLKDVASQLSVPLLVAPLLDISQMNDQKLGLDGEHQYLNAGLAVSLCRTWLEQTGHLEAMGMDENSSVLSEHFIRGLATTRFPGRAQVVRDPHICLGVGKNTDFKRVRFYLDGGHTPESIEVCARWFSLAMEEDATKLKSTNGLQQCNDSNAKYILLFNCMPVRDPRLLLPPLVAICADHGIYFHIAIFVHSQSAHNKNAFPTSDPLYVDLSWQEKLQNIWNEIICNDMRYNINDSSHEEKIDEQSSNASCYGSSLVFSSVPLAIKWIRDTTTQQNGAFHFQILTTGSLHLVGDVLHSINK